MEAVFPMKKMLLEYNEEGKKYTHTQTYMYIKKLLFYCTLQFEVPSSHL